MGEDTGYRVGVLLGSVPDTGIVKFLGYGIREEEHITLDNGGTVHITECIWASEGTITEIINRRLADGFAIEAVGANWRGKGDANK